MPARSNGVLPYTLLLLGSFAIRPAPENGVTASLDRKTRAILAYLAATEQPHSRRALSNLFCQTTKDPAGSLRWHLSRIRRQLAPDILQVTPQEVAFNTAVATTDLTTFRQTLHSPATQTTETLTQAVALYRGPFLSDLELRQAPEFDLWLLAERTRVQQLYEKGAGLLVSRYAQERQYAAAISLAQRLLQINPLLEVIHKQLIWLFAQIGQRESALQQYAYCRNLLQQELAVEPAADITQLYTAVRHNRPLPPVVDEPPPAPASDLPARTDFVGRTAELKQLRAAWQRARQNSGATILVEGMAGGGKSRLLAEFFQTFTLDQEPLTGNCYESTQTIPYQPWLTILETWLQRLESKEIDRLARAWQAQLARLLPHIFPVTKGVPEQQEHLFRAVAELLLAVRRAPAILLVEDLQWADDASLQLFLFLAQFISRTRSPTLLLGTFRGEELDDNPALQTLLHDVLRDGKTAGRLVLPPLAAAEIGALIRLLQPELAQEARLVEVKDNLLSQAGGNPLYVTEILRELAQTTVVSAPLPIPPSLQELTNRRLRRLPESSRQVLESVAVLDQPAHFDLAQQISGRSENETIDAIEAGLRWHFLQPHPATSYDFSHDLIRQAIQQQLSDIRRQRLHHRAASMLTQQQTDAATLAYHWEMAGVPGQAARYALLAGDEALSCAAFGNAINLFQKALDSLPQAQYDQRFQATLGLVKAYEAQSQIPELEEQLVLLAGLADKTESLTDSAQLAAHRASLALLQGRVESAQEIAAQGLEWAAAAQDERTEAELLQIIGKALRDSGEYAAAQTYAERALMLYRELKDKRGEASLLDLLGQIYDFQGRHQEASTAMQQALVLSRQLADPFSTNRILGSLGGNLWTSGELDGARAIMEEGLAVSREIGDRMGEARHHNNLAGLATAVEDYKTAVVHYQQALQIAESIQFSRGMALYHNNIGGAYVGLGDRENALRHLEQAVAIATEAEMPRIEAAAYYTRGCAFRRDDDEAARAEFEKSLAIRRTLGEEFRLLLTLIELAETCADIQDFDAVTAALAEAIPLLESLHDQIPQFALQKFHFAAYRLHTAQNDQATAVTHLKQAHAALQLRFAEVDEATRARLAQLPLESELLAAAAAHGL